MLQIKIALTSPVLEMAELFLFIVVEIKLRKQCPFKHNVYTATFLPNHRRSFVG